MLFATYPPAAPPRKSNPWLIILGVCGGGCVLVVIAAVVIGVILTKQMGGMMNGAVQMPVFVMQVQKHQYTKAAKTVAPSAQATLTADKLQAIEEKIEAQLGPPVTTASPRMMGSDSNTSPGADGQPKSIELIYRLELKYQKGSATAFVTLKSNGKTMLPDGITGLKIEKSASPDSN